MLRVFRSKVNPQTKIYAKQLRRHMTGAEKLLWEKIKSKKRMGCRFRRQHIILGWIADFYCPQFGLVIEVDGSSHWNKREKDEFRDNTMIKHGFRIMRFTNDEVLNRLPSVIEKIKSFMLEENRV